MFWINLNSIWWTTSLNCPPLPCPYTEYFFKHSEKYQRKDHKEIFIIHHNVYQRFSKRLLRCLLCFWTCHISFIFSLLILDNNLEMISSLAEIKLMKLYSREAESSIEKIPSTSLSLYLLSSYLVSYLPSYILLLDQTIDPKIVTACLVRGGSLASTRSLSSQCFPKITWLVSVTSWKKVQININY